MVPPTIFAGPRRVHIVWVAHHLSTLGVAIGFFPPQKGARLGLVARRLPLAQAGGIRGDGGVGTGGPPERVRVRGGRLALLPVELVALGQLAVLQGPGGGAGIVAVLEAVSVLVANLVAVFIVHGALGSLVIVAPHPVGTVGLLPLHSRLVD